MDRVRRLTQHEPVPCAGASGSQCKGSFASKTATSNVFDSEESEEAGLVVEPPPRRPGGQMVIYVAGGFYRKVSFSGAISRKHLNIHVINSISFFIT